MEKSLCCHPLLRAVALILLCSAPLLYLVFWGLDLSEGVLQEVLGWEQAVVVLVSLVFPCLVLPRFEQHWREPGAPWDLPG